MSYDAPAIELLGSVTDLTLIEGSPGNDIDDLGGSD